MCYKETSKADEVRQLNEKQDEALIDLILSGKERNEAYLHGNVYCPMCKSDSIQITETAEGDSERVYLQMKCLDCGCEFVLVEDLINACRRGIENAKAEIEYNKNKIKYFNRKMRIDDREWMACDEQAATRLTSSNKKEEL